MIVCYQKHDLKNSFLLD